jgi:cobalt-zinc-cadmium efflux system protein
MTKIAVFERYRLEVLAALVNGLGLACIAAWIMKEALVRLQSPSPEVYGLPMLITALIGLAINCINVFYLHGCSHNDINLKGVMLHLFADLVSSVGTIIAAIAVIWLNWTWADGAISLVVATLIAILAAALVVQSVNCLRGRTEAGTNIFSCLCNVPNGVPNANNNVYCIERIEAEKILYPTLRDMIK